MQVTVEAAEGLERRLKVAVPEDRIRGEVDKRLNDMASTARIPGFRPGKAPVKVLARRFGSQVRNEVVGEILQSSFADAIEKENLRPAGMPTIDPLEAEPGTGLTYTATFDVYPQIELAPVDDLAIARPQAAVTDTDVERMIETLRQQRRVWAEVERAATREDRVRIDFEGFLDDGPLEHGSGKDMTLELNGARMIPGFEEGLVGAAAGESRTLSLAFPEEYHHAEVAGKPVRFEVQVHAVEEATLPELDESFASDFGVREGGVEAFLVEVRGNMERELADTLRNQTKQRVMDALLEQQTVDVPRPLLDQEIENGREGRRQELMRAGIDPSQIPTDESALEAQARRRVSLGLLLSELVRANDIKVDPERVRERIEIMASTFEDPDEVMRWYYSDRDRLSEVESGVLEDQVIEWILERAKVSDEQASFDAVMNPGQTRPPGGT